jgi:glucose dehydrogenase
VLFLDSLVEDPENSATGASVWGRSFSFDLGRNHVYIPTGQPHDLPQSVRDCEKRRYVDLFYF